MPELVVKYRDEAGAVFRTGAKNTAEAATIIKRLGKAAKDIKILDESGKAIWDIGRPLDDILRIDIGGATDG